MRTAESEPATLPASVMTFFISVEQDEKFRQDLFFRVNVFPLQPPPLRERRDDIAPLADYFIAKLTSGRGLPLTEGAQRLLFEYSWPGNVRELANAIERAVILAQDQDTITAATLSFLKNDVSGGSGAFFQLPPDGINLEEVERDFVRQALNATAKNQTAAAKLLGLSRAKFRVLYKQVDD